MKGILIALMLTVGIGSAFGQFKENVNYTVVSQTATATPTVTEFFSIYCGHCFQFEPLMPTIKKELKAGTTFDKSHVDYIPRDNPEVQAGIVKAYVIMDQLGEKGDEVLQHFFNQIHLMGRAVESISTIKTMFEEKGVSKADIDKYFSDKTLDTKAKIMARAWEEKKVTNVPALVVNGKYLLNMASVNSIQELMRLVNYLVEKK